MELPAIPTSVGQCIPYLSQQSDVASAVQPYRKFENKLREVFAQNPTNAALADPYVNVVPLYAGHECDITTKARNIGGESQAEKEKYLLQLTDRRPHGDPAIVTSLKEFKENFTLFSESALSELGWKNIVAAGSSVATALIPVMAPHNTSKRALRGYYHEKLAPASDVDLFLYGLNEEQALEKIKQIERQIKDSILSETTTVRTKNTITIASQYPTRHVQIVIRLYKSISEILTGFDVDCSGVAFDGQQVWATPRAVASFMSQTNHIDLSRRSPSYENRLAKYAKRGFEVYWADLDRSRIDPTIFERSFTRVQGLARLLVLEKLPSTEDRENYSAKRRAERGRPALLYNHRKSLKLSGNIKDTDPDDIAEWAEPEDVSNYHSVSIPYGPRFTAKRIEKLLYKKDLLLNAEWNKPKEREANLHRHPAFFGSVNDVIHDCCGFCPPAATDEDLVAQEKEDKIYVSGELKFMVNNPGRQAIGSFNPITNGDWADMAYIGETSALCHAIVDRDLEAVQNWCKQEQADVNRRDHVGRTPLHLAAMCSSPEVVQCLITNGARIVSKVVDGFTALHIAAHRGHPDVVRIILEQSESNKEEEEKKERLRKQTRQKANIDTGAETSPDLEMKDEDEAKNEDEFMDGNESNGSDCMTEGFVKIKENSGSDDKSMDDTSDEHDVYDVDVLSWDAAVSPLHLAIMSGHIDVMDLLIDHFGADVLLPVKIFHDYDRRSPRAAILTIMLALRLPLQEANKVVQRLLFHGVSSGQADFNHLTALHYVVNENKKLFLDTLIELDGPVTSNVINFIVINGYNVDTPLLTAIRNKSHEMVDALLQYGAKQEIEFEAFAQAYHAKHPHASENPEAMQKIFQTSFDQPIVVATRQEMPELVIRFLNDGIDPNTLSSEAYNKIWAPGRHYEWQDGSLLDLVRKKLKNMRDYLKQSPETISPPESLKPKYFYLEGLEKGSYAHWLAEHDFQQADSIHRLQIREFKKDLDKQKAKEGPGDTEKKQAVREMITKFEEVEQVLLTKSTKMIEELHPTIQSDQQPQNVPNYNFNGFGQEHLLTQDDYFKPKSSFNVPDLTPVKKDRYSKLFQAVWEGDVDTVTTLTMKQWGSTNLQPPLQIATHDLQGFTPFSIAIIRGHFDLAEKILKIAAVQYQPHTSTETYRYTLEKPDSDLDSIEKDDGDVRVIGQLVDEQFTINDVAALAGAVKSRTSPMSLLQMYSEFWRALGYSTDFAAKNALMAPRLSTPASYQLWNQSRQSRDWFNLAYEQESQRSRFSLLRYAIAKDDMGMLKFLLRMRSDLEARTSDQSIKGCTVSSSDFDFGVRLGRTEMIGELLASTGTTIPLERLVQKSGIDIQEKPKYYQGLSVYGKKRKDWADGSRGTFYARLESEQSPLLAVILEGNLESVEYFLTDAPLRRCLEFTAKSKDDKRVQALSQAEGGIEAALKSWLFARNELALHMSVMSKPRKDGSNATLEFLIRRLHDESLDTKSASGTSALQLAFELQRYFAAKSLIQAGAYQVTRNLLGENILHSMIKSGFEGKISILKSAIGLLDQKILPKMLLERCSGTQPGSLTPLALYLRTNTYPKQAAAIVQLLLEYSNGKDLEIMDGAGDYPLHTLVRQNSVALIRLVVEHNPELLYRENATGRTPLEVVETSYLRSRMENPPQVTGMTPNSTIIDRPANEFLKQNGPEIDEGALDGPALTEATWKLCNDLAQRCPGKRVLISLFDANEIAKRLAAQQARQSEEKLRQERVFRQSDTRYGGGFHFAMGEDETDKGGEKSDEVTLWKGKAQSYKKVDLPKWERESGISTKDSKIQFTPDSDSEF